jgi:hypothetical protein
MIQGEEWLPVTGFEETYEVSSEGRVRGVRRQGSAGGVLAAAPAGGGHLKVSLYCGGRRFARWVHRLVLEAFVGPAPAGCIACHFDGDPANNRQSNLRWDTPAANYDDARRHGTALIGERNPATKLSPEGRAALHRMKAEGATQRAIAQAVGLSQQHVSAILREARR